MGSSISVRRTNEDSIFVNKAFIDTEAVLKVSDPLRFHFVKFIKEKKWVQRLGTFEEPINMSSFTSSTWNRFGYKSPHCSGTRSTETKSPRNEGKATRTEQDQLCTERSCSYWQDNSLDGRSDLRSILIAALMPIFLSELERQKTVDIWTAKSEAETLKSSQLASTRAKTPGRLELWLSEVSDMFTADDLDDYLGDGNQSWIADYKSALLNLPVKVTLCTVDVATESSPIVYNNVLEERSEQEGVHLHELYSEDCSPGGAVQVRNAIFGGKKYKRSLTNTDGQCRLRALKPVFNSLGQHVYSLGVVSCLFEDPVLQACHGNVSEKPFEQVEDMLLVLPLLIRAPLCAQ